MAMVSEALKSLKQRLGEIEALEGMNNLLFWDKQLMLPPGGQKSRTKQIETLALVIHERSTSKDLGNILQSPNLLATDLSPLESATIREARRNFERKTRVPVELEMRLASLGSTGYDAWINARSEKNFQLMAPSLEQWLQALKEEAAAVAPEMHPYNFCLDKHERGATVESIDAMFSVIKQPLIDLLKKVADAKREVRIKGWESLRFPVEAQKRLGESIVTDMGFRLQNGRLDSFGGHPMTMPISSPSDVRLTTRYREDNLMFGVGATIHEAGHGLYEQGADLEAAEAALIAHKPPSMGLHESQSLLWERMVGLSREFWICYWPRFVEAFPELELGGIGSEDVYKHVNVVKPGFQIRVDADELSYPLHVLLRYEIEKGLFDGSLSVGDIPGVWKAKMEEYVGKAPEDDGEGCLQDVHWGMGAIGYFPTYVIGAIYACQIFEAAGKDLGEVKLKEMISEGKMLELREWLREKIHRVGSTYETAEELVQLVTGKPLDAAAFLRYLTDKYSDVYSLS